MSKAITPAEARLKAMIPVPNEVFEVINELIIANFSGGRTIVKYKHAAEGVASRLGISTDDVYKRKLLNVEDIYRQGGWKVKENSPNYTEDYEGYWTFEG